MADKQTATQTQKQPPARRPRSYVDILTSAERQLTNAGKLAGTDEARNALRRMALQVAQARIAAEMVALGDKGNGAS